MSSSLLIRQHASGIYCIKVLADQGTKKIMFRKIRKMLIKIIKIENQANRQQILK